jgi:hypothetical protein
VEYGVAWRKNVTWKETGPVFWKMHVMECCLIRFIEANGMTGLASTEGFEAKHYSLGKQRDMLMPIVKTDTRVQKTSQRQQISLVPKLAEPIGRIEAGKRKGIKRGPYNKSTSSDEEPTLVGQADDAPRGYFTIEGDGLLPEEFADVYNFYKWSIPPVDWSNIMESLDDDEPSV